MIFFSIIKYYYCSPQSIMSCLLSEEHDQAGLIKLLPSLLTAWQEDFHISSVCLLHVKKSLRNMNQVTLLSFSCLVSACEI